MESNLPTNIQWADRTSWTDADYSNFLNLDQDYDLWTDADYLLNVYIELEVRALKKAMEKPRDIEYRAGMIDDPEKRYWYGKGHTHPKDVELESVYWWRNEHQRYHGWERENTGELLSNHIEPHKKGPHLPLAFKLKLYNERFTYRQCGELRKHLEYRHYRHYLPKRRPTWSPDTMNEPKITPGDPLNDDYGYELEIWTKHGAFQQFNPRVPLLVDKDEIIILRPGGQGDGHLRNLIGLRELSYEFYFNAGGEAIPIEKGIAPADIWNELGVDDTWDIFHYWNRAGSSDKPGIGSSDKDIVESRGQDGSWTKPQEIVKKKRRSAWESRSDYSDECHFDSNAFWLGGIQSTGYYA